MAESENALVPKSPIFGNRNRIGFGANLMGGERKRLDSALDCARTRTSVRKRRISVHFLVRRAK